MSKPANLREAMPLVTEFIDACRDAFGKDEINQTIRAGMAGMPVFYASENGHTIGTPIPEAKIYTIIRRDMPEKVTTKRGRQ